MRKMNEVIHKMLTKCYRSVFVKKSMYKINKLIYRYSLMGLGIMNYESGYWSGEDFIIEKLHNIYNDKPIIVMDIGANNGDYSVKLRNMLRNAIIYAFEPHPVPFEKLNKLALKYNLLIYNLGCGETKEQNIIYDYINNEGSEHASLYKLVIEELFNSISKRYIINMIDLDSFCEEHSINKIHFLKIDVEGHELSILKGAKELIESNSIDIIQFEFNQMNIYSRVFFKDIVDKLNSYDLYRLLPDGIVPLGKYDPVFYEIYAYQNILAINHFSPAKTMSA